MIGTIRKHQQTVWIVVIAATIVSFVYAFAPSTRTGGSGQDYGSYNFGSINGEPITREQYQAAYQEGRIYYWINTHEWPDSEEKKKNLESYVQQRLLINSELEQFHIHPTAEAAARYIRQLLGIKPEDVVSVDKIWEVLDKLSYEGKVTRADWDRFARDQVGQDMLIALVGMSGKLITPQEAEVFYRRENQPMQTELVTFPYQNYYAKTNPTPAEIEDFYNKHAAEYRVPDRIEINYVAFPASNYTAKVEKELGTNLNDLVSQQYLQQNPASYKDSSGRQLTADEARAKIKKQIILYNSMKEANKEAGAFLNDLSQGHDEEHPYTTGDLMKLARERQLSVKTTAPFDQKTATNQLMISPQSIHNLFALRNDDPDDKERSMIYAPSPLVGDDAVYVAGLQQRYPSAVQPLATVRDQVIADYKKDQAVELAKAAGARFEKAMDAGLSQGKTFDTMCAAQFVHPQRLTPFALTSTNIPELGRDLANAVMNVAARMQPGQVSPFVPTSEGGFLIYYKAQLPADEEALKRDLPEFLEQMRGKLQVAAFNAWFNKEYQMHFVPPPGEHAGAGG